MKKQFFTFLIAALCNMAYATDRVVDQTGAGGAFFTIQSAVDAAASGDRIIITTGVTSSNGQFVSGQRFIETVSLTDKSLQFIPRIEGERFQLFALNINFTSSNNFKVVISGVTFFGNGIVASTPSSAFNYTTMNVITIVNSAFDVGLCTITGCRANLYNVNLTGGGSAGGQISLPYGKVIGCKVRRIIVNDVSRTMPEDTVFIVGNFIQNPSSSQTSLDFNNPNSYGYISNNYVISPSTSGNTLKLIDIRGIKISTLKASWIINNTLGAGNPTSETSGATININVGNTILKIYNNLIFKAVNVNSIIAPASALGFCDVQYNQFNTSSTGISNNVQQSNNSTSIVNTVNSTNGVINSGPGIDGGHSGNSFVDLDGTRNDVGTGGGSFDKRQFTGPNFTIGSQVGFLFAPRVVHPGEKINIKVDGYDK